MTILLLETLHHEALALLAAFADVMLATTPEALDAAVAAGTIRAILTRGKGRVSAALLDRCPDVQVVARCGVGLDNIDTAAVAARNVPLIYAPGSTTQAAAEHTLMLMLALARRLRPLARAVHAGNWAVRDGYQSQELAERTLGVIGLGAIGQRVAELGAALGMHVIYWSRSGRDPRFELRPLDRLLAEADVVSVHVALADDTQHLIGTPELALLKPGALLINTARGAVIDQAALLQALAENRLGGFAADVLEREPPAADDPLLHDDRVLLTPHTAALTDRTYREICVRTAANVLAVLRGEQPEAAAVFGGQ